MRRGSDSPDLPGALLLQARDVLAAGQAQVALGPALDGGYYLVGLKSTQPELFRGQVCPPPPCWLKPSVGPRACSLKSTSSPPVRTWKPMMTS